MIPVRLYLNASATSASGFTVANPVGYNGASSALVSFSLSNLPGQKPWALGQARITSATGVPVRVLLAQMKPQNLAPGEEGLVVVETQAPPWTDGKTFSVEVVDASGQRPLLFNVSR